MERYKNFLLIEIEDNELCFKGREGTFSLPIRIWSLLETISGNYTIIGKADELTEEQWIGIVEEVQIIDPEYGSKKKMPLDYITKKSAANFKKSGYSLLKSKNLSPSTTLIIQDNG